MARFAEQQEAVFRDGRGERCAARGVRGVVGEQFVERARVEDGAGKDVAAEFGGFFDQADAEVVPARGRLLLEPDRRGQTGGAAADDDDVKLHGFSLHCVLGGKWEAPWRRL